MKFQDSKACTDDSVRTSDACERDSQRAIFRPNVDIVRTESEVLIYADLPGVEQDGIEVDFERGILELRAKVPLRSGSRTPLREEYAVGDFRRSFRFAEDFDASKTSAEYHDGVLCLRIPKASAARARRVEIRAGQG